MKIYQFLLMPASSEKIYAIATANTAEGCYRTFLTKLLKCMTHVSKSSKPLATQHINMLLEKSKISRDEVINVSRYFPENIHFVWITDTVQVS